MKNKQRLVAAIKSAMRITVAQVVLAAIFTTTLWANETNGQSILDKTFTLSVEKVPIRSLIAAVQKQTDVRFTFSPNTINTDRTISYAAYEKRIADFLEELQKNYGIGYQVIDNQIILVPAKKEDAAEKKETPKKVRPPRVITGIVTNDKGDGVAGVTVTEKSTTNAVITDGRGNYSIKVSDDNAVLVFSSIGYESREIAVNSLLSVNVTLKTMNKDMEEVIIVGYGAQKKATVTGSISSIDTKEILKSPVSNVTNSLVGRLTGVTVVQRSGAPGQNAGLINIRGSATYNNTAAIVVVDGVERSDFGNLDPNEIESITVLKDAASTAIFGIRGANGVIVVTTRSGREGAPRISYSGNVSLQRYTGLPKILDAYNNAMLINEANRNDNLPETWTQEELQKFRDGSDPVWYPSINWFDYLTRDAYPQTQHNINISGGTKMVKYFVSAGYLYEDGMFKEFDSPYGFRTTPSYTRYNFRSNIDFNLSKNLVVSVKLGGRLRKRYQPAGPSTSTGSFAYDNFEGMISRILQTPAFAFPVTFPDGSIAQNPAVGTNVFNPYAVLTRWGTRNDDDNNLEGTFQLNYKLDRFTKGLSFRLTFGYDSYFSSITRRNAVWRAYNIKSRSEQTVELSSDRPRDEPLGSLNVTYDGLINSNLQAGFNYDRKFNLHNISGLILGTRQVINEKGNGFDAAPRAMQGLVGRIAYNYAGKYFAEFNAAYNGSEAFAPGKQYGFFPAISAGWTLTNENFLGNVSWLNILKIRGSYGLVGNDKLNNRFLFLDNYTVQTGGSVATYSKPGAGVRFGLPTSAVTYDVVVQSLFGNSGITWETGTKRNIGLEATLFDKQLSLVVDVFDEKRKDILTNRASGLLMYGQNYPALNIGEVYNKGYEIELNFQRRVGNVDLGLMTQLSYARNKILNRDEPPGQPAYQKQEGKPVGQFFGYMVEGFYQSEEDIASSPVNTLVSRVIPGDLKYRDYNGDGKIDADDRVAIGYSRIPEYTYSFSPTVTWRNLSLSVLFQGVANVSSDVILSEQNNGQLMYEFQLDRWTSEKGNSASWPSLHSRGNSYMNYQLNDFILQDASYLKIRNAELSWMLPQRWVKSMNMSSVRVYVSGQNLHTWTKFKMYLDPENINLSRTDYLKQSIYPTSRIYNFGVNVQF